MAADRPDWLVLRIESPSEEAGSRLAEGLVAFGATAVQEDRGTLVTWLRAPGEPEELVARVSRALLSWNDGRPVRIEVERRADEDWSRAWRAGLGPRRIGRIVVAPTWSEVAAGPADVVIRIDPQMAFGTGEHASTRGVLHLLQERVRPGAEALDVGTGSAVLAIAAAGLGARHVLAVDNDADALLNAGENVRRNGATTTVSLVHATIDAAWAGGHGRRYDLILANVLSGVLVPLLPAFRSLLRPGGAAILAGILDAEAAAVRAAAAAAHFAIGSEYSEQDWWCAALEPISR